MASIVLLIASGTIDTYTLHQSRLAVEQFQLDARSRESRRPRAQFDVSSGDNPDAVTRALAFIWSEFDPRHFLSVVSDPFVPPSFSLRAEEALSRDEPKTPPSARLMATQTALRKAGRICGCPENLSPAEKREASESLYWHPKQTAELDVFEAHHGAFCKELHLGLESGMLRSWVVLLFFGRGVARAARAAVPQASDRKELRAIGTTTLVSVVVLVLFALFIRAGNPPNPQLRLNLAALPASGGEVELSWNASKFASYDLEVEPKANVKLAGSSAHIKIPANLGDTPVYYKFILEEKSPLNNRSRQNSASLVVAPAIIVPSHLVVLKSNGNDSATALAVDPAGNIYLAGRTTGSFSGKIPEVPRGSIQEALGLRSSFVARYDAKGNLAWGSELGKNTSVTCIGVDSSGNVYFGGAVEVREAPSGLFNESIIRSRAYLRKYDSNGNDLWARAIDADENDFVDGLTVDREGNVYVTGTTGPADSPSIPLGLLHTNTDAFLAKFDPAGSRIGPIHESGTDGDDGATAIGIDGNGMVYVTGFTDGADYLARYDTDLIKTAFLVQFDAEGRGRWVREYGALFESSPLLAVGADKSEAVYVAGGSGSKRFLAAYDAQGNAAWPQVQFSEFRYGSAIAAFGGAVYQAAGALIAKHDSKGNLQWIYQLDQAAYTSSTLTAGPPGVYIAGQTTGRVELFSKNATQHVFAGKLMPELARAPSITGPEQER